MKFTDGYWLLREGVTAAHPAEVLDVTESDGVLEIHAPTRPVRSRGDLLTGPVLTIRAHSPMPDVVGLTLTHLTGERSREPAFGLTDTDTAPRISSTTGTRRSPPAPCRCGCRAPVPGGSTSSPKAAH